jgi:hypothetical protein
VFTPKTARLQKLSELYPKQIKDLEALFAKKTNIYIDYSNVLGWSSKLGWHVDPKRLKQLLDSFPNVNSVKFYYGTLTGDTVSEARMRDLVRYGYDLATKPVKILRIPIDASSVPANSPEILKNFIRKPVLNKFTLQVVEYLNNEIRKLNAQGIHFIEDRKCNFDVEIGRDMLLAYANDPSVETYILWSGDSDFADPIEQLISDGKKVILFATARRVSTELNALVSKGLYIFDIQKIRDFICQPKEMQHRV